MHTQKDTRLLTEAQAAQYLALSRSTLRQNRMNGPRVNRLPRIPFVRLGTRAIRYDINELNDFIRQHRQGDKS